MFLKLVFFFNYDFLMIFFKDFKVFFLNYFSFFMAWLSGGIPVSIFGRGSDKEAAQQLHWPYCIREIHQALQFVCFQSSGGQPATPAAGNWKLRKVIRHRQPRALNWPLTLPIQHKTLKQFFQLVVFSIYSPKKESFLKFHHLYLQQNVGPRAFRSLGPRSEAITNQGAYLSFSDAANI